jgi:predicted secreted hydrolase
VNRFFISAGLIVLGCVAARAEEPDWALSLPGWKYEFPRDHFAHPEFKTEWWYFTGNLVAEDGREFGFQLTFFRQGVRRGQKGDTRFAVDDIKLAHFAVTDISGKKFRFAQKVSRGSFGEAGFSDGERIAWIDDWTLRLDGPGRFRLEARDKDFALALDLRAAKEPVFHGENGVSQKSAGEGRASHYYSFTRLAAEGTVTLGGREIAVKGWSWFDQEWATNQLTENQTGWDWLSLQFEDNTELMLFQIRLKDGGRDPFSHGTWIDADGKAYPVKNEDFDLVPGRVWRSGESGGDYPVEWTLRIPELDLELKVTAAMDAQELILQPISYWEGSVRGEGTRDGQAVRGRGYLEMTGYAGGLVGLQAPDTR